MMTKGIKISLLLFVMSFLSIPSYAQWMWNIDNLNEIKKALHVKIIPVTQKKRIAASGDRHDYVSMAPYWWPDSTKTDGLPYIRRDGQRNPELKELDREKIDILVQNVSTLTEAYIRLKNKKYAKKAVNDLKIWFLNPKTRMNPNLNYAQMIPGRNDGSGRPEGIIDAYSFVKLIGCIEVLFENKALKQSDYKKLQTWFSDFLDWLLNSDLGRQEYAAENNHGVGYDVQATAYALFANRPEIAEKFISNFPEKRIFRQIEPDGSQPRELARTMALHYSIFNLEHFLDMCDLAKKLGIDLYPATSADGRNIAKAIDFIAQYIDKPQSEFPYQQIRDWDEKQEELRLLICRAKHFSQRY